MFEKLHPGPGWEGSGSSWADCLPMINARHPEVAARTIAQMEGDPNGQSVQSAAESAHRLAGVRGFEPPQLEGIGRRFAASPTTRNRRRSGWQT